MPAFPPGKTFILGPPRPKSARRRPEKRENAPPGEKPLLETVQGRRWTEDEYREEWKAEIAEGKRKKTAEEKVAMGMATKDPRRS